MDEILFECVQPFEVADCVAPLVANGCNIKLLHGGDCYQVFDKGNIPEEYKF